MTKEFVPYDLAIKLKELGFEEKCFCNWEESWSPEPEHEIRMVLTTDQTWLRPGWVRAPTFSQAFRWFREEHGLFGNPDISNFENKTYGYAVTTLNHPHYLFNAHSFSSMEEAELACLDKLIEIVELKQQEQ